MIEECDYTAMTVAQLKEALQKKGLPTTGKKAELIQRLTDQLENEDDDAATEEDEEGETVAGGDNEQNKGQGDENEQNTGECDEAEQNTGHGDENEQNSGLGDEREQNTGQGDESEQNTGQGDELDITEELNNRNEIDISEEFNSHGEIDLTEEIHNRGEIDITEELNSREEAELLGDDPEKEPELMDQTDDVIIIEQQQTEQEQDAVADDENDAGDATIEEVEIPDDEEDAQNSEDESKLDDSREDSLEVDVDPSDVAAINELDDTFSIVDVTIDTVGEVDDEFGQDEEVSDVVQNTEQDAEPTNAQANEQESKDDGTKKKDDEKRDSAPPASLMNWYMGRYSSCRRFCSVYFHVRQPTNMLRLEILDWAQKCVRFNLVQSIDGTGAAIFDFRTEQEGIDCKDSILALFGTNIDILHPSRSTENQVVDGTKYRPLDNTTFNKRTCIVEGMPQQAKPEDLLSLFPEASMIAKPLIPSKIYRWRNNDYNIPDGIDSQFLVEFAHSKVAEKCVDNSKELQVDGQQLKVQLVDQYITTYRKDWNRKHEEQKEKKRLEEAALREKKAKECLSDEERMKYCRELADTIKERSRINRQNMPLNNKISITDELSKKVLDIVRTLDADTDKRVTQGKGFPEPVTMMTKRTKQIAARKEPVQERRVSDSAEGTILDDTERCRLARQLKMSRESKVALENNPNLPWNQKMMSMDKLEKKMSQLTHRLDIDTKLRMTAGQGVPEPIPHMTKYTRQVLTRLKAPNKPAQTRTQDKEQDKDKREKRDETKQRTQSRKEDDSTANVAKPSRRRSTSRPRERKRSPLPDRATMRKIDTEVHRLEADNRGWWSVSADIHKEIAERQDVYRVLGKFGKIMEVHYTKTKVFVRFNSRDAANRCVRTFYVKYNMRVPEVNPQYKAKANEQRMRPMSPPRRIVMDEAPTPLLSLHTTLPSYQQQMMLQQQQQQQQLGLLGEPPRQFFEEEYSRKRWAEPDDPGLYHKRRRSRSPSPRYYQEMNYYRPDTQDEPAAIANVLKGLTQVISSKMEMLSRSGPSPQVGQQAMKEVMETLGQASHTLSTTGGSGLLKEPRGLLPRPSDEYQRRDKSPPKPVPPPVQYPDPYGYDDRRYDVYGYSQGPRY